MKVFHLDVIYFTYHVLFFPVLVRCCENGLCVKYITPDNEKIDNHILADFLIENVTTTPQIGCTFMCALRCDCVSYSEAKDKSHCLLNYESNLTTPNALQYKEGYTYANVLMLFPTPCPTDQECDNDCCLTSPCSHGAQCTPLCTHPRNKFSCACPEGYTGTKCQIDIDDCASSPCLNGGICEDGFNSFQCTCAGDYTGQRCETSKCEEQPCLNGGTCTNDPVTYKYKCACANGYGGTNCDRACSLETVIGYFTGDNQLEVLGDGVSFAESNNWGAVSTVNFPPNTCIVGLIGTDAGGVAAILGSLTNGIVTDSSWKCSNELQNGWETADFDDSSWSFASVYGHHGIGPWGNLQNIDSSAQWIWTSDNDNDNLVYCRISL